MGIDMNNYKMIYKDQVFNVVNIIPNCVFDPENNGVQKIERIEATIIDENGELNIISDEASEFKFVRR